MEQQPPFVISNDDPYFSDPERRFSEENITEPEENLSGSVFKNKEDKEEFLKVYLSTINLTPEELDEETKKNLFGKKQDDGSITQHIPKIFEKYAARSCNSCYSRGFSGWLSRPDFPNSYIPKICKCVIKNISKIKRKEMEEQDV